MIFALPVELRQQVLSYLDQVELHYFTMATLNVSVSKVQRMIQDQEYLLRCDAFQFDEWLLLRWRNPDLFQKIKQRSIGLALKDVQHFHQQRSWYYYDEDCENRYFLFGDIVLAERK